jgi:hypothetical protein
VYVEAAASCYVLGVAVPISQALSAAGLSVVASLAQPVCPSTTAHQPLPVVVKVIAAPKQQGMQ